MFKNKFVKWGIVVVFLSAALYSLTMNQGTFEDLMKEDREEYLENLMNMEDSPVADLEGFTDFVYYPANKAFQITAEFEEVISDEHFTVLMTDGTSEDLEMAGTATFTIEGKEQKVMLFDEGDSFLLPFRDDTNGKETYGGGRYINVVKTNNNRLMLDFNKAHNFYCAYNERFICPVPPKENTLTVAILVGEKVLH